MRKFLALLFLICLLGTGIAQGQNLKIALSDVKKVGNDGDLTLYETKIKVVSGSITEDYVQLVYPLSDGKIGFALLETFGERFTAGQSGISPMQLKTIGFTPANGQNLVSPDLVKVTLPANRTFKFEAGEGFLGDDPKVVTAAIKGLKGFLAVGDEFEYLNYQGKKGRAKIEAIEVDYGTMKSTVAYEGLPDHVFNLKMRKLDDVSFSGIKAYSVGTAPATTATSDDKNAASKAKIKTFPVNVVLEDKNIKITVHNLIKYNPSPDEGIDLFKVDYSLDYYIVDATLENKSAKSLDCGDYLTRFNFFTPDGKSSDEYTRIFKKKSGDKDEVSDNADKLDVNVFGGTGKLVMASVLVKYQVTIPDYDTKHRANTLALGKPLPPGEKIRSIDATIMGVPPDYAIVGLGTWTGAFFDKKNLIFVPVKLQ
jgi:hypothetical protein